MRSALRTTILCAVVALTPALARAQVAPLTIQEAVPDLTAGTLTVAGTGFGQRPFVTLDLVPLNIQLAMDQRLIAVAPVGMMPRGTYLLTITRGAQPGDTASVQVQLGDVAPVAAGVAAPMPAAGARGAGAFVPLPAPTDAAARVGDRTITLADLDREWQRTDPVGYLSTSRQLFDARRRVVHDLVNAELLAREAASRQLTVDALLAEELPKRTVPTPDTAVTSLFQSLGDRARGASIDQLRPALREWLARKVEPELAKMSYLEELTKVSTRADVLLEAPTVVVEHAADDPVIGPATAPVEVVMFGDFQDQTYARYALTMPRVRDLFGARVRFVFKHFPANDPASIEAAEAAACANLQGKFWPFHDTLLGRAGALDASRFRSVASEVGLDRPAFDACLDGEQTRERLGQALEETRRYDLSAPGSLLVNGRLAPEPPSFLPTFEFLKRLVEEELARQARAAR